MELDSVSGLDWIFWHLIMIQENSNDDSNNNANNDDNDDDGDNDNFEADSCSIRPPPLLLLTFCKQVLMKVKAEFSGERIFEWLRSWFDTWPMPN